MRPLFLLSFCAMMIPACTNADEDTADDALRDAPIDENIDPADDANAEEDDTDTQDIPNTGSIDDACDTSGYGYTSPSSDAKEALERTHCYRNLMGIEAGELEVDLDSASQSHSDYMHRHDELTHWQDPDKNGFTGEWVWDRIEAAGFNTEAGQMWSEVVAWGNTPTAAVDMWVGSVYHRIPFTMPYWIGAGFGQTGDYSAMSFVSPWPDGQRTAVTFPVHGQSDVPTSFDSDTEWPDPAPNHGVVGYPISVTVAAPDSGPDSIDPYRTSLVSASLHNANGDALNFIELDPSNDDYMTTMVAIVPTEPFRSGTQYTASLTVSWDGSSETFVTTFTTE